MSASTFQIEILEFINRGKGDLLDFHYLTLGEVVAKFGEESEDVIMLLMEHGMVKKVGWKNRLKSMFQTNPPSWMDQIRTSSLGLMRIEKFYAKRLTVSKLPPLMSKPLVQTSVVTPLVLI